MYVELLNPGGEIVSRQILPIRNGRCQGNFTLTHLPFYSGFYEVRAYTKYMLNFGEEVIFSRVLPVFDKPRVAGEKAIIPKKKFADIRESIRRKGKRPGKKRN